MIGRYVASTPKFAAAEAGANDLAVGSNGARGSGAYTIDEHQEGVSNKALDSIRSDGYDVKIFEHTLATIKRVLG